jgi:hypothetical protein
MDNFKLLKLIRELRSIASNLTEQPVKSLIYAVKELRTDINNLVDFVESDIEPLRLIDEFLNVSWNWYQSVDFSKGKPVYDSELTDKRMALFNALADIKDAVTPLIIEHDDNRFVFSGSVVIAVNEMLLDDYGITDVEKQTIYIVQAFVEFQVVKA